MSAISVRVVPSKRVNGVTNVALITVDEELGLSSVGLLR